MPAAQWHTCMTFGEAFSHTDIGKQALAAMSRPLTGVQPNFTGDKGHCGIRPHRQLGLTGIGIEP